MCEGSVYVTCKIIGVSILALIDTGSAVNILKEGFLANLKLGKEKLDPNTKKLYGDTGKVLDTGLLKNVPIFVDPNGRVKNGADLLVVTNMSEDLILGQQFLSQHKFCIDFNKNRLFNSHLSTKLVYGNNSIYRVIVEQDVVVNNMTAVPCKIVNEKGEMPCINFERKYRGDESLGYASGKEAIFYVVENGTMDICFANLCSNAMVKIPKGATLGWIRYSKEYVEAVKTRKWEDKDPTCMIMRI